MKKYEATEHDHELHSKLIEWREEKAQEALGDAAYDEWGSGMFMADQTVQRLVDCAHVGKLPSVEAIFWETRWRKDLVAQFGASLLEIVTSSTPSKPPASS